MSSLPVARKVISERPPKDSLASPTVKADQEADVDRKMRLYGVIQAFRKGRMPDNKQIDETLLYIRNNSPVATNHLSTDGKQLVYDTRVLIETTRQFVREKNADEIIQEFLHRTSDIEVKNKKPEVGAPVSGEKAKGESQKALDNLRTLVKLLIKNSEARKLLSDVKLLGRNVFADAASNVADRARPAEEDTSRIDEAAPRNEFKEESTRGKQSTPGTTKTGSKGGQDQRTKGLRSAVEDAKSGSTKKSAKPRLQNLAAQVPEEHKKAAHDEMDKAKSYLHQQFPKERRDQFIYRLKKVVVECQEHPDYQESLSWFLTQIENYFARGKHAGAAGAKQSAPSLFEDPALNQAASEARLLLERLANGQSMEGMFSAVRKFQKDSEHDEELHRWWHQVITFVRKTLLEPGFILNDEFESEGRHLQNDFEKFFDVKYEHHFDALIDSISSWFHGWSEDPLNKRLGDDAHNLYKDLLFDAEGELAFKPHLLTDIRKVILPTLIEKVGYVPIPRVEYASKDIDMVLENLTVQGRNFLPKIFDINVQNHVKVSPFKEIRDEHDHEFTVSLSQIQVDMQNVSFYFRSKKGISISDHGLADIFLGGNGLSILLKLTSNTKERDNGHVFTVKSVKVTIDALKFAIRDSKHDLLYRIVSKVGMSFLKKAISNAISDAIRDALESADDKLADVRDRLASADATDKKSKTNVLRDMWSDRKDKTKESKSESQFRIMPDKDSMLFPDKGHEIGWSRKQFDREIAAEEGNGWKSKA